MDGSAILRQDEPFFGSSIGAKRGTAHFGVVLGIYFVHECVGIILYIYIYIVRVYICVRRIAEVCSSMYVCN